MLLMKTANFEGTHWLISEFMMIMNVHIKDEQEKVIARQQMYKVSSENIGG